MRVFLRLLGFLKSYKRRVALAVLLGILTVVSNVGLLATAAYVISAAALRPLLGELALAVYLVRLFSVSRTFSRYAERLVSHNVTFRLLASLRTWFYGRLEPLAPARLLEYRSGDLLARIVKDVEELENIYLRVVSPILIAIIVSLLTFLLFYVFDPLMAFAALGLLIVTGVGVPVLVRFLARGLGRRQLELRGELNARIVDGAQGAQDLLAFGREEEERREVSALDHKLGRVQKRMAFITGLQGALGDLMMNLSLVVILVLAVPLVARGEIDGVYLAFLAVVMLGSFEAVQPLGGAFQFLGRSLGAGERLFEVIDAKPQVTDPPEPAAMPAAHTLEFDRVGFRYEEGGPLALEDVSFVLKPGSRVAVVGPSGSGKSTIVNLALRFWDPVYGEIRLGDQDIRGYAQEDLRAQISVVSENTHIFGNTLRANLLLANPGVDEAALKDALAQVQLTGLLKRLPQGLDGYVGEQGLQLSGGERQRLAVARALLKSAPVLILDEATANLDPITEREIMAAILELMRDRTTLVITHRLVGMEGMDGILVLDEGRIVERGTHEELVKAGGLYSRMLEVQKSVLVTP